jgi:hypothetical protein
MIPPLEENSVEWYHRIKEEHKGLEYFSRPCKCFGCSDSAICSFYKNQLKEEKKYKNLSKLLSIHADLSKETATPSLFSLRTNEIDGKSYDIILSCVSFKFRFVGQNKWHRIPWKRLKKAIKNTDETST